MTRIIAGGTGFIGRHLVPYWLQQDHEIIVLGRRADKIKAMYGDKVSALTWEQLKQQGSQALSGVEVIVNLTGATIGEQRWTDERRQEILSSRIESTRLLARLCAELKTEAPVLINTSAVGIYGLQEEQAQGLPKAYDEDSDIDYDKAPDFLAKVGRAWEQASQVAKDAGVKVIHPRFAVVLAEDGGALEKMALPFQFFIGGKIGSGKQPFSWIAIDDLLRALDFSLQHNMDGPINLVAPDSINQGQFATALGKAMNRPSLVTTPGFVLRLAFGDMADELLLRGQHVQPKRLLAAGFEFQYPNIESALRHIYSARDE